MSTAATTAPVHDLTLRRSNLLRFSPFSMSSLTLPCSEESRQQPNPMRPLISAICKQVSRLAMRSPMNLLSSRASAWAGFFCGFWK
eukprot:3235430-Pyramimonas_sp.AAC.1